MSDVLIKCEGVSKKFCKDLKKSLWYGLKGLASEAVGRDRHHETLRDGEFWASRDISFEVKRGECLGLIGHNGAGKTTLLKMLNGLIRPDKGRIEMKGQIGAMIALGAGFNPILTGRENIYIAGSLRGMSKRQIDAKLDEIIAFAEMEEFIDMPVQSYSSGMQVRLGFAAAVNMEPDVLLIDEVLAVGDIAFRLKCYNAIAKIVNSAAVIFVSHSMPQVGRLCNRGLLLDHGNVKLLTNDPAEIIHEYNKLAKFTQSVVTGDGRAKILDYRVTGGVPAKTVHGGQPFDDRFIDTQHGAPLELSLTVQLDRSVQSFRLNYSFLDTEQRFVAQCAAPELTLNPHEPVTLKVLVPKLPLNRGTYSVTITIINEGEATYQYLAMMSEAVLLNVQAPRYYGGSPVQLIGDWTRTENSRHAPGASR